LIENNVLPRARKPTYQVYKGNGFNLIFCLPKEKVLAVDGEVSVGVSEVLVGRLTKIL
jgi:thiamine monophosphate kinase